MRGGRLQALEGHALVVGINDYAGGIARLQSAVADAHAVTDLLRSEHGYAVTCLTDAAASAGAILRWLADAAQRLPEESAFLLYFGGHGVALGDGSEGPQGYLLSHDARAAAVESWLSMAMLRDALQALPCRHLLVVLDCCFAGAFRWSSGRDAVLSGPLYDSQLARYLGGDAWQALTSAAHDQRAADISPGARNTRDLATPSPHSPFAAAFLRGLRGAADSARGGHPPDGVMTATELHQFLFEELVPARSDARQVPGIWPMRPDNIGEFIFLTPGVARNTRPDPPLDDRNNPWLGLRTYSANDARVFFGRARVVAALLQRVLELVGPGLLVVVGASGTGKSSVVKAGLLPALAAGDAGVAPGAWTMVEAARLGPEPEAQLGQALRELSAATPDSRQLLLFDQFEELYTQCPDADLRERFLRRLRALLAQPDGPVIVLTLRSDFEPRLAACEALADLLPGARYLVPGFSSAELREIIEGPAASKALYFEPAALIGELLDEIEATPGALPLLSFALAEMYRHAQLRRRHSGALDRALTQADQQATGGVVGGLHRRASALFEQADPLQRQTIRRVFLRMVTQEGARLARRRVHRPELDFADPAEQQRVDRVIRDYVEARLLVVDGDYIEPAHDTLVVAWEKLQEWLAVGSQELQRALWRDASDWASHRRDPGLLWDGDPRLAQAEAALEGCNRLELDFVRASGRRRRRRRQWLAGLVTGVISALSLTSWYALERAGEALRQTAHAEQQLAEARYANGKAALERARLRVRGKAYFSAAMLAAEGVGFRGFGADDTAASTLRFPELVAPDKPEHDHLVAVLTEANMPSLRPLAWRPLGLARFSGSGAALAGMRPDGVLEVRRFGSGQLIELVIPEGEVRQIALGDDADVVAALTGSQVHWWMIDASGNAVLAGSQAVPTNRRPGSLAIDSGSRQMACATGGAVLLWALDRPLRAPAVFPGRADVRNAGQHTLVFAPRGEALVLGGWHNGIARIDIVGRDTAQPDLRPSRSIGPAWGWDRWSEHVQKGDDVSALAFSADGARLAVASANRILVGERSGGGYQYGQAHFFETRVAITAMALAGDGRLLAVADADGVHVLSFPELALLGFFEPLTLPATRVTHMSFGADASLLVGSRTQMELRDLSTLGTQDTALALADPVPSAARTAALVELQSRIERREFDAGMALFRGRETPMPTASELVDRDGDGRFDQLSVGFGDQGASVQVEPQLPAATRLALGVSLHASRVLGLEGNGFVELYEVASQRKLMRWLLHENAFDLAIGFSADGAHLQAQTWNFDGGLDRGFVWPTQAPDLTVYVSPGACQAPVNLPPGHAWVGSRLLDCPQAEVLPDPVSGRPARPAGSSAQGR